MFQRTRARAKWTSRRLVAAAGGLLGGCAAGTLASGPPLPDPTGTAVRLAERTAPDRPAEVRFHWEYGDERGRLSGEGVARVNPPDSFRLDLFTSGEGSMQVALTADGLVTLGEIEDLELPPPPLLYAMSGVFRPGTEAPVRGFRSGEEEVLAYEKEGATWFFSFRDDRLRWVEERAGSRLLGRVRLEWEEGRWPRMADYREYEERPRRVRWRLDTARTLSESHPPEIYDLGAVRSP